MVTETVQSIRAVKLHAWEPLFLHQITERRRAELKTLAGFMYLGAVTSTLWLTAPTMAAAASFLIKSEGLRERLSPAAGFTSLTLFQLLSVSLTFLPSIINQAIMAAVGLRRIEDFLALPDVNGRDCDQKAAMATTTTHPSSSSSSSSASSASSSSQGAEHTFVLPLGVV